MADPVEDPKPEQALDQRVSSLETGQESITQKIDKLLGLVSGDGHDDEGTDDPGQPGVGTNIAHEIRQQLDAKAKEDAAKAKEDGLHQTVGELKTKVSELAEKPPAPMPRRVEKLMGWS